MSAFLRRLMYFLRRSRHDADLRDEIEAHRAHRQDALERDGLASDAAAWASQRAMGNVTLAVEDVRDVWVSRAVDQLWQDIRIAVRGLRKNPVFTLVAIAYSGAGHRRQYGAVLDLQRSHPAPAARARPEPSGAAHSMDRGPIRSGRRSRLVRTICSTAPSRGPTRDSICLAAGRAHLWTEPT